MNYKERIENVRDFIGKHLDEDLSLEKLSKVACFSKYHFHRLFTVYVGLSLRNYIKWLRLKRAAHQLISNRKDTIITIALDAGFETHESFSRAFKKVCGQNPREFRSDADWHTWENPPDSLQMKGKQIMDVTIKESSAKRLAMIEHHGDPEKLIETLDKLIVWSKEQSINLKPKPGEAFGFGYNDPREVDPEEFRCDLGLAVPDDYQLSDEVIEKIFPAGRYAVVTHKGSRTNLGDTINSLYRDWLPKSGEQLGDFPCVFRYYNFDNEVAETELVTEIWMLLE